MLLESIQPFIYCFLNNNNNKYLSTTACIGTVHIEMLNVNLHLGKI